MERLDPRVRLVWGLGVLVSSAIVGAIATGIVVFVTDWPIFVGIGAGVVVMILGLLHTVFRYRIWRYDVQEDALYLERGVFTRVRTVVPFVRIQHVDTQRNPIERAAGIGSVVVYTAGSRGADVSIPGLDPDQASELQHRLRRLVGESEAEDAV
ncbi:MAG: PH domain-containing protein [Halanaeroarchaeum sp.]